MGVSFLGVGMAVPEFKLLNFDLERMVDTSDEWIISRTGIKSRHISRSEDIIELSVRASSMALEMAKVDREEVDVIILATITPKMGFPATACLLQEHLGCKRAYAFDVSAACSGFLYGLELASALIQSGKARKALLIGAETLSQIVDWNDRSTCVLFGDGAGAVLLGEGSGEVIGSALYSDGSHASVLYAERCSTIQMKGKELFKLAVRLMADACHEVLKRYGYSIEDVSLVIPHQANARIITALAERLGLSEERVFVNIQKYGNTSAASIPIAICEAMQSGLIRSESLVLLTAMGGGLTWGATLVRF
ncbi:MAG: ketoacyl-ACP synthase III [Aquificaceae bacterium]|nr:ketoacyl-ACP synthase III [Aquificaceae bacterium]MDW8237661.1 beta-ketoacyl-ACP synthase III [Aquificaceae bacterium]